MATPRKAKKKEPTVEQVQRAKKLSEVKEVLEHMTRQISIIKTKQKAQLDILASAIRGHYEEMDKLSKKAPAEKVTNLALGEVNYLIEQTRNLLSDDVLIQRYKPFVAAGDNPELRDVVMVLRQLLQGLDRFRGGLTPRQDRLKELISEAKGLAEVLELYVEHGYTAVNGDGNLSISSKHALGEAWFSTDDDSFLFDKLERTDIERYFAERAEL